MKLTISSIELQAFLGARRHNTDFARHLRKEIWAGVRTRLGIPRDTKLKVEIDERHDPDYLVLKDKHTGATLFGDVNGRYSHSELPAPAAGPTTTSAGVTPSDTGDETARQGSTHEFDAAPIQAGPFVDAAIRSGGEDRVVQTVSNAGLVRYVAVAVSDIASLADARIALMGGTCDIIIRADAGRVAYDADEDTILVRLDADTSDTLTDDVGATQG